MIFQHLWYRFRRLIAKTGLFHAPRPPFYRSAARRRNALLKKDYSGGMTFDQASARYQT